MSTRRVRSTHSLNSLRGYTVAGLRQVRASCWFDQLKKVEEPIASRTDDNIVTIAYHTNHDVRSVTDGRDGDEADRTTDW